MIKIGYWNLYSDLKEGFERIDNEYSQLQSEWKKFKSDEMSEGDLKETIDIDMYDIEKDWVRSILCILDVHLEEFKLRN
jgi:hypothetical protein